MDFQQVLKDGCFSICLKSDTKEGIIEEMIDLMVESGKIADRKAVLDAVLERERKMSTGMQHGIALPHGKTNAVDHLEVVFALKKEGVDFGAMDGQPSRIFVMTISPANSIGPHMAYLAEIGKLLSSPTVRERVINAKSRADVVEILAG